MKLFRKNSQISEENIFTGIVTYQDAGVEFTTLSESDRGVLLWNFWNFWKQIYAEQLRATAFECLEMFWEISLLEIANSS